MRAINIFSATDNNYAQHLGVTIVSLLENKLPETEICYHIIDGGISKENKLKLQRIGERYKTEIRFLQIDRNY